MVLKESSKLPLEDFSPTVKVSVMSPVLRNHLGLLPCLNNYQEAL